MTTIYVDATPSIALGTIGELELLTLLEGTLVVLPKIQDEVTADPARTKLLRIFDEADDRSKGLN